MIIGLRTWYQLNISIERRKGVEGSSIHQSMLIQSKKDRETAHKLLDAMIDEMGGPE